MWSHMVFTGILQAEGKMQNLRPILAQSLEDFHLVKGNVFGRPQGRA